MNKLAEDYVSLWRRVLTGWLCWPEERLEWFVARWNSEMHSNESLFFHDPPMFYIAPLLIPLRLRKKLGDQCSQLEHELEQAIQFDLRFIDAPEYFDWLNAKKRVELVLAAHSEVFPTHCDPCLYDDEK